MINNIVLAFLVLFSGLTSAQTIDEIKKSDKYLWGQGVHQNRNRADKLALDELISQISVQVESKFTNMITETNNSLNEYTKIVVNTY